MMIAQTLTVPKITANLIKWKQMDRTHDNFWTEFVNENPSFSQMVANIVGTEHNSLWEDRSSNISFSNTPNPNKLKRHRRPTTHCKV